MKALSDDEVLREYADAARRCARVRPGDYRGRNDAMAALAKATREMVKAFGSRAAEAQMMTLSAQAIRDVSREGM